MFALYSYCGQKLLYADFANKIYQHINTKSLIQILIIIVPCRNTTLVQGLRHGNIDKPARSATKKNNLTGSLIYQKI